MMLITIIFFAVTVVIISSLLIMTLLKTHQHICKLFYSLFPWDYVILTDVKKTYTVL